MLVSIFVLLSEDLTSFSASRYYRDILGENGSHPLLCGLKVILLQKRVLDNQVGTQNNLIISNLVISPSF